MMYRAVSYTMQFGGYKRSALGRELGQQAVLEYMQTGSVWISTAAEMANPFAIGRSEPGPGGAAASHPG